MQNELLRTNLIQFISIIESIKVNSVTICSINNDTCIKIMKQKSLWTACDVYVCIYCVLHNFNYTFYIDL